MIEDLRFSILALALREEKKDYLIIFLLREHQNHPETYQQKFLPIFEWQKRLRDISNSKNTFSSYFFNEHHSNIFKCMQSQTLR